MIERLVKTVSIVVLYLALQLAALYLVASTVGIGMFALP